MIEFFQKFHIDIYNVILMGATIICAILLTRLVRWLINKAYIGAQKKEDVDLTRIKFIKNAVSFIIWLVALGVFVSLIPQLKSLAVTLFAGAGILLAILGFAAQQAFSNIIGGIFIVIFKPFRVGDMIKVGNQDYAIVEDITLRHTVLLNFENKRIIVPNSMISAETIINDSIGDTFICKFIHFGISYDSDVDLAIKIIEEESILHPFAVDHRTEEEREMEMHPVEVRLIRFSDSSVELRAYVWTNDPKTVMKMQSDISRSVKKRFEQEGIEIPFPYRTIVYKNDLTKSKSTALK